MTRLLLVIYSILELSGMGGWSTNNTSLTSPEPSVSITERGSAAYGLHVGYALQLHRNVGIGLGVDLSRYGSSTLIKGDQHWMNVKDTEGELYHHRMHIYSLTDKMQQLYVNIPLSLRILVPMGRPALEVQLGAKVGFPIWSSASYKGDVEHFGLYPQWGDVEMSQVPNHGFYRTQDIHGSYSMPTGLQAFAFAKLGIVFPITHRLHLTAHAGIDYGLLAVKTGNGTASLGCNNNSDPAHSFMPFYNGILSTQLAKGGMHPLSVTAEIGLRFVIEHKKKFPCRCYMW